MNVQNEVKLLIIKYLIFKEKYISLFDDGRNHISGLSSIKIKL